MRREKSTIVSISEQTGYSISTVSRVLNNSAQKARISQKAVDIILKEAKRCNYQPSIIAKSLRTKTTHTIGVVIPTIDNPFFANLANVILREVRNYGYISIIIDTMGHEADEREGINSLLARNVDGLIVVPCGTDPSFLESVNDHNAPLVLVDRYFENSTLSHVATDNYKGGYDATQHLIDNGHSKILCIQGIPHSMSVKDRVRGYTDAMCGAGFESNISIVGDSFSIENGYLTTKIALQKGDIPTAIFAQSNTILLGAIKAIKESNLRIPEDISLISFDNNTFLDYMAPPINRMSQPINDIGNLAVKLLIQHIKEKSNEQTKLYIPSSLVVCKSVYNRYISESRS